MSEIIYRTDKMIDPSLLKDLFNSVGWAQDLSADKLQFVIFNSSHAITAWDKHRLVGLIRSMDDNGYSANIDLLLVHKDYQGQGIATHMIEKLLDEIKHIQYISTSPNESKNFKLYTRFGFQIIADAGLLQKTNI